MTGRRALLVTLLGGALTCAWSVGLHRAQRASADPPSDPQPSSTPIDVPVGKPAGMAAETTPTEQTSPRRFTCRSGSVRFVFYQSVLDAMNLHIVARGTNDGVETGREYGFSIEETSTLEVEVSEGSYGFPISGELHTRGALMLNRTGGRTVAGNLAIVLEGEGEYSVVNTLNTDQTLGHVFHLTSALVDVDAAGRELNILAELTLSEQCAAALGVPQEAGTEIGTVRIVAGPVATEADQPALDPLGCGPTINAAARGADPIGPDVIVAHLQSVLYYGGLDGIHSYAIGTTACNIGDSRAKWIEQTNEHPVIAQNMYRLKDDRFEQIGLSWLKHGFYAVSQSYCTQCYDDTNGSRLGVGCSDPYTASLNGEQTNMSPRTTINPHTAYFEFPWEGWNEPAPETEIERRLQVKDADVNPNSNPGALYFIQGHYILADDAAWGNNNNNASYRLAELTVMGEGQFAFRVTGQTQRGQPAVRAWQDVDEEVVETDIQISDDGLFILAGKAIDLGGGQWRYSYALQNLNSDRCARSFSVPVPDRAEVANVSFHDVDYHSGDPVDGTNWPAVVADGAVTWSTDDYDSNPDANALRFGTVYSFSFECNVEPASPEVTIGLFKSGDPAEVTATTVGPLSYLIDCNNNQREDRCDIDCNAPACSTPCGESTDCDANGVPDECEPDCNENLTTDACDILGGSSEDCNTNEIPDECDVLDATSDDCDVNGVPDECEPDCQPNEIPDACDILDHTSEDCNSSEIPDECELLDNDCNGNSVPDECDADCNDNQIPDDCEPDEDCNENGEQDICDVASGYSDDCNDNMVPDECDPDCDGNGFPDDCVAPDDADQDGIDDCNDLCPTTSPVGACTCPPTGLCCWLDGSYCIPGFSPSDCVASGGVPECLPSLLCYDGCLFGDVDDDGDLDLRDFWAFQDNFSGSNEAPDYVPPSPEAGTVFDFDHDEDIDLSDGGTFQSRLSGP